MIADMSFPMNQISLASANLGDRDSCRSMGTIGITTTISAERGT